MIQQCGARYLIFLKRENFLIFLCCCERPTRLDIIKFLGRQLNHKKSQAFDLVEMEVERIELSSLNDSLFMTTCLSS